MPRRRLTPPSDQEGDALAEQALADALKLPHGPARSEALKKASQLRLAADTNGILFAKRGRPAREP
jgi:hypothetical protein